MKINGKTPYQRGFEDAKVMYNEPHWFYIAVAAIVFMMFR